MRALTATALLVATAVHAAAQTAAPAASPSAAPTPNAAGYPSVPLLSTGTTVLGETIRYPDGNALVNASIITLVPGQKTIMHKHGVPMFAYILEGAITVDYGRAGKRVYAQGQSLVEAMDVAHFGANEGTVPVRLLVVYMGSDKAKDVIPVH